MRLLSEKLLDDTEVDSGELKLSGAIELHRLAVDDFAQLSRRAEEISEAIVDAYCSVNEHVREVRQSPPPS